MRNHFRGIPRKIYNFRRNRPRNLHEQICNRREQVVRAGCKLLRANCQSKYQHCGGSLQSCEGKNIRFDCKFLGADTHEVSVHNSNLFLFPLKVRVIRSQLYVISENESVSFYLPSLLISLLLQSLFVSHEKEKQRDLRCFDTVSLGTIPKFFQSGCKKIIFPLPE